MTFLFGRASVLRSFSWKGLGVFILFAAALSAWAWSGVLLTSKTLTFDEHAEYFVGIFQRTLLSYAPIYVLCVLADGLPLAGMRRRFALSLALVLGVLLAVQLRCAALPNQLVYIYTSVQVPYCTAFPTWRTYFDFPSTWIGPLGMGALVMVFILGRRRDAQLVAALHAARGVQIETRRQRIESEIAAMHARVDPDSLLETLRFIRTRYEESCAAGEERLDALILELRVAAQPPA